MMQEQDMQTENRQRKNKYEIDMTNGTLMDKLISFSLPLMLSGILQLMFNAVDIIVVGRFTGSGALAAVGSTTALINVFTNLFIGISLGANVLAARFYAAGREKEMSETVHTAITLALVSGLIMAVAGVVFAKGALTLMDTPADVIGQSALYMRIYFVGMPFFMLYNYGAAILRAVGDTKRPLIFLIVSGVINALLNLFLVIVWNMGVAGVAIATVISQMLSVILCMIRLIRTQDVYQVNIREIRFDWSLLKQIIHQGLPSGMQNSIISIANMVVQSNINSFGKMAMAGCGSYSKIEGFGFLPITCFAMAMTTFIGQNLGAREFDRVKKGARFGILCGVGLAEAVGIVINLFIPQLIALFDRTPEVIQFGVTQAKIVTLFYFLLSFSHVIAGIMRGAGKSMVPDPNHIRYDYDSLYPGHPCGVLGVPDDLDDQFDHFPDLLQESGLDPLF